jgi:hypothetical protein
VRSAIGYDEKRGDTVEMVNLRFTTVDEIMPPPPVTFFGFERADILKMGEMLVIAVVAMLFILLVVRPLLMSAGKQVGAVGMAIDAELDRATGCVELQANRPITTPATHVQIHHRSAGGIWSRSTSSVTRATAQPTVPTAVTSWSLASSGGGAGSRLRDTPPG